MDRNIVSNLKRDLPRNISILGFFENYPMKSIYVEGDTMILLGESDHLWAHISSTNENELARALKNDLGTKYFANIENWMKPILCEGYDLEWELTTFRYILPSAYHIESSNRPINSLDFNSIEYIFHYSDYKSFTSVDYIKERIEKGISAGIMEDGKLVAWGLTHDDDSLGFLHVLPEYREKGYGMEISKALINQKRSKNQPIFLNVEPQNEKSINLVKKFGFEVDRKISWIKLK